jgi:hypothetical protein
MTAKLAYRNARVEEFLQQACALGTLMPSKAVEKTLKFKVNDRRVLRGLAHPRTRGFHGRHQEARTERCG